MQIFKYIGPSKPPGYAPRNPTPALTSVQPAGPYGALAGAPASALFTVLSGVAAAFNGLQFAIDDPFALPNKIFQFYTGAPPAPPIFGMNIVGDTLASQIAVSLAAALGLAGYITEIVGPGFTSVRATQPFPGVVGNVDIFPQAPLMAGLMTIQTVSIAGLIPTFAGGAQLAIPLRFGRNYCLGATPLNTPLFRLGVG